VQAVLLPAQKRITPLEVKHSIFELAFARRLCQDESGEKDVETVDQNFVLHVERDCPRPFPQK
jgi:hypothetical protein